MVKKKRRSSKKSYTRPGAKKKENHSNSKTIEIKFTTEPIVQKDYDLLSEEDQNTLSRLYHMVNHHPETIKSTNDEYFLTLNRLKEKYSNYPTIWNYITMGYDRLGLHDKVRESTLETFNKFPDYLFGMTSAVNVYLKEGQLGKAIEILGNINSLPEMYPNRNEFHVAEGRALHHTLAYYNCAKGNLELAQNHLKILELVSKMMKYENDPLILHIRFEMTKLPGYTDNTIGLDLMKQLMRSCSRN